VRLFAVYTMNSIPIPAHTVADLMTDSYSAAERAAIKAETGKFLIIKRSILHGIYTGLEAAHIMAMSLSDRDFEFHDQREKTVTVNPTTHAEGKVRGLDGLLVERRNIEETTAAIDLHEARRKQPILTVCQVAYNCDRFGIGFAAGIQAVDIDNATGNDMIMMVHDTSDEVMMAGVFSADYMREVWIDRLTKHHKSVKPVRTTVFSMSNFGAAYAQIQEAGELEVDYLGHDGEQARVLFWLFKPDDNSHPMHSASVKDL
jgi:hypothetical protein